MESLPNEPTESQYRQFVSLVENNIPNTFKRRPYIPYGKTYEVYQKDWRIQVVCFNRWCYILTIWRDDDTFRTNYVFLFGNGTGYFHEFDIIRNKKINYKTANELLQSMIQQLRISLPRLLL